MLLGPFAISLFNVLNIWAIIQFASCYIVAKDLVLMAAAKFASVVLTKHVGRVQEEFMEYVQSRPVVLS